MTVVRGPGLLSQLIERGAVAVSWDICERAPGRVAAGAGWVILFLGKMITGNEPARRRWQAAQVEVFGIEAA